MAAELAEIDNESALEAVEIEGKSSQEIATMIRKAENKPEPKISTLPKPEIEEETSSTEEQEEETEEATEETEEEAEPEEKSEMQLLRDQLGALQRQNETLLRLADRANPPVRESKQAVEPTLTKEQKIELFLEDPDGFLDSKIAPYKKQLAEMDENNALNTARGNKDFARLEPLIDRLKVSEPELGRGLSPLKRNELYLRIARTIEWDKKASKESQAAESKEKTRKLEKQKATMIPKASKKVQTKSTKSPEEMTSKELEAEIRRLGG